jgi:hypothetical protein
MAMHLLSKLSLGYLADRLAHAVGWSPVAKLIVISGVEGPSAGLFEGVTGIVRSVEGGAMTLDPGTAAHRAWSEGSRLCLTARHEGWTPFSLCLRPIAVVVEVELPDGRPGPVAIGVATVLRRRGRDAGH